MTHHFTNPFSDDTRGSTWMDKCIYSPPSLKFLLHPDASVVHFATAALKLWQETQIDLQSMKAHYSGGKEYLFPSN